MKMFQEMPQVTMNNRRMTNVPVGNGDFVQGIRRNPMDEANGDFQMGGGVRPLRYTSGNLVKTKSNFEHLKDNQYFKTRFDLRCPVGKLETRKRPKASAHARW